MKQKAIFSLIMTVASLGFMHKAQAISAENERSPIIASYASENAYSIQKTSVGWNYNNMRMYAVVRNSDQMDSCSNVDTLNVTFYFQYPSKVIMLRTDARVAKNASGVQPTYDRPYYGAPQCVADSSIQVSLNKDEIILVTKEPMFSGNGGLHITDSAGAALSRTVRLKRVSSSNYPGQ